MSTTRLQDAVRRIIECYWHPAGIGPAQRFDEQTTILAWADLRMSLIVEQLHTPMPNPEVAVPVDAPDLAHLERDPADPNRWHCRLKPGDRLRVTTTGEMATFKGLREGIGEFPPQALILLDIGPYMGSTVYEPLGHLEKV